MTTSRRTFLKSAAGLGTGSLTLYRTAGTRGARIFQDTGQDGPILDVEAFNEPVIIDSIDLLKSGREFFVRVRSRDGAQGIAVTNSRANYLYPILHELVIPYFLGKDARDIEDHLFGVYRHNSNYKLQGLAFWCPVSWVEFAILDMLGRIAGKAIGELFGTILRTEVDFYVASGRRDTTADEEVEYLQQLVDETGGKAVKFRVGGRMSRNADALPGRTENLIPLARRRLGDEIDIHADANSSYDPEHALRVGRLLEEIDAVYFEEPCPFDHLEETKQVADALSIPVAGGEQEYSAWRFDWMIRNRGVDIVQPDLQYYGGLIRSARVARQANAANIPATAHISGGFGFVYMLHFASFVEDVGAYQEYKREIERYANWFDPALKIRNGRLSVPSGPGVGIKDPDLVLADAAPFR